MRCIRSIATVLLGITLPAVAGVNPLGSAFTYQGQLSESGQPAAGLFDFELCLFDSTTNPAQLLCAPVIDDVLVEDGLFSLVVDFGAAPFAGQQRFLELRVRPGASTGSFTVLSPRQLIRANPEALRAATAPWAGLTEIPADFADNVDNDSGGTVTSIAAGTGLSGGIITGAGTLAIANEGVGQAQIAAGAVSASELANNAVDSAALQSQAVTTSKLDNAAVTAAKVDSSQVQLRAMGACPLGSYLRGINENGSLLCSELLNQTQSTTVSDSSASNREIGRFSDIAIGDDGLPIISFEEKDTSVIGVGQLKVAKCSDPACTGATVTTVTSSVGNDRSHTSIAIGDDGLPIISFWADPAQLGVAKCVAADCTGSATLSIVDMGSDSAFGQYTSIAIRDSGLPVISYIDPVGMAGASAVKLAVCATPDCSGSATILSPDSGPPFQFAHTSVAIGADGTPILSYQKAGTLKFLRCPDVDCNFPVPGPMPVTVDASSNVGAFVSLAVAADGMPIMSYYADDANALRVAKCVDLDCILPADIHTIDAPANSGVGQFTSIAVPLDGRPVISYQDQTADNLKLARCENPDCSGTAAISVVDAVDDVGFWTSIAIGMDGLPIISHHDATAQSLKVAKCNTSSCR